LTNHLPPAAADRQPHGHLAGAAGRPHQQQVRRVRARDDQHERGHGQQQRQRRCHRLMKAALAAEAFTQNDRFGLEAGERLSAHTGLERRLDLAQNGLIPSIHLGASLLERHPRLEPPEQVQPVTAPIGEGIEAALQHAAHRERHEQLWTEPQRRSREPLRCDAHDGKQLAIDQERFVDHERVGVEVAAPVVVRQHRHRRFADDIVIGWANQTAQRRSETEHREVTARDERGKSAGGLVPGSEVDVDDAVSGNAGETRLHACQILKHRVAEHLVAVAGLVALVEARLWSGRTEVDQITRRVDGQRAHEHLLEHREDRSVGANAEGKGQDCDDREAWSSCDKTHAQPEIAVQFAARARNLSDKAIGAFPEQSEGGIRQGVVWRFGRRRRRRCSTQDEVRARHASP
jgi:hypothetical protein